MMAKIMFIREFFSTLYVGLMDIVKNLIQKSTGIGPPFLSCFFFLSGSLQKT